MLEQANNTVAETAAKAELARQEEELTQKKQEAAMQAVAKGFRNMDLLISKRRNSC